MKVFRAIYRIATGYLRQHPHLRHALYVWLATALIAFAGTAYGQELSGFDKMFFEFESIKGDPGSFHVVFILGNAEIHIVSGRELFGHEIARNPANNYGGYTVRDLRKYPVKEVWVIGKKVNGLIVVNWAILGHEICHVLNFENKGVMDPDVKGF